MKVSLLLGDIADAPADAICTSTNARLSLMMGTGGSVREKGGFEIQRAAETLIEAEFQRTGRKQLRVGGAYPTTAGSLPYKLVIHCVASDPSHMSSSDVVRACVKNALSVADAAGCGSLGMPLFATGHASFRFDKSVRAMAEGLRDATTDIKRVLVMIDNPERIDRALEIVREVIPSADRLR